MILDLPKLGAVRFDDNLTPEQLNAELDRLAKKYEFELPKAEMGFGEMASKALTRGTKRLGSTFGDIIPAMGAKALGFEEYAQKQLGEAAETEQEIAKYYAPQYPELKEVKGISDVPGFFLETIVEQIPNIATSIIPGVGAGVIAARTGLTSLGKSLAVQGAEKGLAGRELAEFVAQGMAQGAATRQAVGQGAGVFLGSYAQNAPEIFQNIYQETGQMDVGASLLFGAGSAALDSVLPAQLARSLTGPVKAGIVEKVLEKSGMDKGLLRSITAGTLKGMGAEGLTEGAQEAISIYAENFVGNNPQIFESADWNRIMESSVRGAVAGSAFGGAGGVGTRVQEKRAEFAEQQAKLAEQQRQELARQVQEANLTIDEYNALQKQGMLPGMELGAYTTRLIEPRAKEEAQKELKGKQLSLFDEQGLPTKTAEASRIKGDKAEANRLRQLQQKEAAELKASQAKLKKFLAAKQGELNLTEAPPFAGVAVEGQPDLFGATPTATPAQPVAEPSVVTKPVKLTPKEVATKIDDGVLGALGIGSTALIRKNKLLEGKDISNPADAAEVKRVLEAYADRKNLSTSIREKVEEYLSRPEFQQEVPSEPISKPAGPVGGAVQSSLPSDQQQPTFTRTPETIAGPVGGGLATTGPAPVSVAGGEEAVSRPLTKKQQNDLKKAEDRLQPAIDEENQFIAEIDKRVLDFISTDMGDIEGLEDTDAFKLMRIAPLTQEYVRLKEVTEQIADAKQREKNLRQMEIIRNALAKSHPDAATLADRQSGDTIAGFTNQVNEMARAELAIEQEARAQAPITEETMAQQERRDAIAIQDELEDAELTALTNAVAGKFNVLTGKKFFLPTYVGKDLDATGKRFVENNDLQGLITHLAKTTNNKDAQRVLNKIKGLNLKTKIEIGSPTGEFSLVAANKNWFSGSEITNPDGTPKIMYHGTVADIDNFVPNDLGLIFVSPSKKAANEFAVTAGARRKVDNVKVGANVMPVYAKSVEPWDYENPRHVAILARNLTDWYGSEERAVKTLSGGHFEDLENQRVIDTIKELGFDGMYINEFGKQAGPEYKNLAVFSSNQLQSAISGQMFAEGKSGSYDPATNTIVLDPKLGLNEHTAIHELVHAAISHVLRNPSHPLTKELIKLYEGTYNQLGSSYGALDIQEFAAELISNPEFQATLKAIKAPRSGNMFQRMMQAIAEFFGFRKAYTKGVNLINDIVDISSGIEAGPAAKMYHGVGPSVNKAFTAVGQIGQSMPALAGRTVEETKNFFSNVQDYGVLKAGMGLLRLDNLNTIYGKELPSIQTLVDALEKRNGQQEQEIKKINDNYKRFSAAVKADPKAAERMNNMAVDARLAQVDPLDPNFKPTAANAGEYRRLRSVYTGLPPDLQNTYKDIRQSYEGALQRYEDLLLRNASPSMRDKLRLEFEARKKLVAYIPFLRSGDYWLEYADPKSGERTVQAFQSARERDNFVAKDLPSNTKVRKYRNLHEARFVASEVPPTTFIGGVIRDLKQQGATDEMINSVYQSYLALMPAESISKRFMKSEDVLGMERDIVRGYGDTMIKWSRKLADSEFAPQIDRAITGVKNEASAIGTSDVAAVSDTINEQSAFFHNPTYGKVVSGLTSFSYFEYIAGNISSALINLSTLPMFSWPILGGKFGFDKASSAMLAAGKVVANGLDKNPKYKALYESLMDHAQFEHTMAREVLEARRMTTGDYLGVKAKILDTLSIPFSATEKYNRGVTAVAAFDLARAQGMSEADAIKYAVTTVKDINTSGMAVTAPKYMQSPVGRVFFTFKSFVWNSAFIVARAFHQAYKGESKEVRRIAQRQLLGIYGMAGAFAGVKGLPFFGIAETIAQMLNALFGDDEPFNFDEEMRDFFGELLYKGPTNFLTNLEIANRTGVAQDLIFRDDPRGIAEHGYVLSAMKNAFGPAGSYLIGAERSIKAMNEGQVERGIEGLVPSWLRNGMKGLRYMSEGALTLKGDPVQEDIGAYNSLMQIIGFSPASLSSTYEKTSAAKGYDREVAQRKQRLLNKYDMARTAGDSDLMAEAREDIEAFNSKRTNPKDRITGDTLSRSMKARQAAEKSMINGVSFNRNRKAEIEEKFFSDEED